MRKLFSTYFWSLLMVSLVFPASAEEKKLTFNSDGNFRILQIKDFQCSDIAKEKMLTFLNNALDIYKPDLVVLVGDQLDYGFHNTNEEKASATLNNLLMPLEERGISFLFTFGKHDREVEQGDVLGAYLGHDQQILSLEKQQTELNLATTEASDSEITAIPVKDMLAFMI